MASLLLPSASTAKTNNLKQSTTNAFSFGFSSQAKSTLHFSAKGLQCNRSHSTLVKAQLNEVRFWNWFPFKALVSVFHSFENLFSESPIDFNVTENQSVHDAKILEPKSEGSKTEKKNVKQEDEHTPVSLASDATISEYMTQVSNLVKLVDSRDVAELQLKMSDCELVIRKKAALPQPSVPDNAVMMHSPPSASVTPTASASAPAPPSAHISSPTQAPAPSVPSGMAKSSHPPLKCPMAGTFYRCPGPGEPPFVKVGDKVQKGQVVCIIEAMKLMNEIEADRSGTIVEVLVDDGKPVSVDTPLFAIEP